MGEALISINKKESIQTVNSEAQYYKFCSVSNLELSYASLLYPYEAWSTTSRNKDLVALFFINKNKTFLKR